MKTFKAIRFEDLKLTPAEMRKIAEGAQLYLRPEEETSETETVTEQPTVTKRNLRYD